MTRNKKAFFARELFSRSEGHASPPQQNLFHDYNHRNLHSRMQKVDQDILAVDVINVDIVAIGPISRPRTRQREPVSAVLKPRLPLHYRRAHLKRMLASKMRLELGIRNFLATLRR